MGAILHLPQGGAQIVVVSEIPEVPIPGEDATTQEILATLGTYTQVVAPDGTYRTIEDIWADYEGWEKASGNGDMVLVNDQKHNGLNFQPQSTQHPYTVSFMYIDRVMNFASKRVIGQAKISEGSWGNTIVKIHIIPYSTTSTVDSDIAKVKTYLDGGAANGIVTLSFRHNGFGPANDDIGIMLGELASAGRYKIAISMESDQTNVCPSIYQLNFRTY